MRVLVTGNQGYIGSVLTGVLMEEGYEVVGLDSGLFRDVSFVPRTGGLLKQIYKDIRDVSRPDLDDIDMVIHLAGLSNDPLGEFDTELTMAINYKASLRLAELAKSAGVSRFLFSSTCSTYGKSGEELVNESSNLDPRTAYAESKVRVEEGLAELTDQGFDTVILRNATVFGVSPRLRVDLVVQNLAATGWLNNVIEVLSDGQPWRPLIHVSDVASAFAFLLKAPAKLVSGQSFNVGHDKNTVQIKDLASMTANVLVGARVKIGQESSPDERSYRVDFSKLYSLGWQPKISLLDGVIEVVNAYQKNKFTQDDFTSDKYNTLRRYQNMLQSGVLDKDLRVNTRQVV